MTMRVLVLVLLCAGWSCGGDDAGPSSQVLISFGESCGAADGCDLDLSCLGAVALRVWTPSSGLIGQCLRGDALSGLERGCDLGELDATVDLDDTEGPVIVELVGFSGDDCAPEMDAAARVLFEGLSSPSTIGAPLELVLSCSAGCAAGDDPCEDVDDCDCCAGVCVDEDAMLHCGGCFTPCDPYRSDMCDDGECRCGDGRACGAEGTCCADGTCAPIGECPPTSCPFAADEDECANASSDAHDCGGGLDADECESEVADACLAGGCTCGGGPACASSATCEDGACTE